jgi:hypothetical protein
MAAAEYGACLQAIEAVRLEGKSVAETAVRYGMSEIEREDQHPPWPEGAGLLHWQRQRPIVEKWLRPPPLRRPIPRFHLSVIS